MFQTVAEFDALIKTKGKKASAVIAENGHLIYQREFIKRVGLEDLTNLYSTDDVHKEGIDFLYTNENALAYFIEANPTLPGMSYLGAVENFVILFNAHKELIKNDGAYLKMAIAVAISQSKPVHMWTGHAKPNNPLERFNIFKNLIESGLMTQGGGDIEKFKALPVSMMIFVINARLHNDDIEWVAKHVIKRRDNGLGNKFLDPYQYIRYDMDWSYSDPALHDPARFDEWNAKWDIECFKHDYTDNRYIKTWKVFEKSAVCGGISKTGAIFHQVFGRTAFPVSQEGHCAYHYSQYDKDNNIIWYIGNDITHIQDSRNEQQEGILGYGVQPWCSDRSGSYLQLATAVLKDYSLYQQATKMNILSDVYKDDELRHRGILIESLKVQPINLDALSGLVDIYLVRTNLLPSHYLELAQMIINNLKYYPLPMFDLLKRLEGKIDVKDVPYFDLLKNNALIEASTIADGTIIQADVCRTMANHILASNRINLVTFSFSGDKANKLVLNPKYNNSGIKIKYSLNGVDFKVVEGYEIELNPSEITTQGILVGIDGLDELHKIDITIAQSPTTALICKNDLENRFIGNIANMQWSKDGVNNWIDYDGGVFSGSQSIFVRYKANGTTLMSDVVEYVFNENTDTNERKYIPLKHLSMVSASSEQNADINHKATNMLDGDDRTKWHTSYNGDSKREYIIKLDAPRYVTSLEYLPAGRNGRLRVAEIQVSMDNATWNSVIVSSELADDEALKKIDFPPTQALYVKIVGKNTWGNYPAEHNKYFSGKDFYLYENITK